MSGIYIPSNFYFNKFIASIKSFSLVLYNLLLIILISFIIFSISISFNVLLLILLYYLFLVSDVILSFNSSRLFLSNLVFILSNVLYISLISIFS